MPPFFGGWERYVTFTVLGASENGNLAGGGFQGMVDEDDPNPYSAAGFRFLRDPSGNYTLFNQVQNPDNGMCTNVDYGRIKSAPNVTVQPEYFAPVLVNNDGWAIGDVNGALSSTLLWNRQELVSVGAGQPAGLNNQGQVLVRRPDWTPAVLPPVLIESYLWENGVRTEFRADLPFYMQWQIRDVQAFSLSNQRQPLLSPQVGVADATIDLLSEAQVNFENKQMVLRRDHAGKWTYAQVQLPAGTVIKDWRTSRQWVSINSGGLIVARGTPPGTPTAGGDHALLLLPVELVDTKNKVLDDGDDVNIEPRKDADDKNPKSIAWIEPHGSEDTPDAPDMPQLVLRFRGTETMGLKIKWKLKVEYKRPNRRDIAEDKVFIPKVGDWVTEALDGAIEIYDNADWKTALQEKGFFGGDAELTYQLLKSDGSALGEETKWKFRIGGKNPNNTKARDYLLTFRKVKWGAFSGRTSGHAEVEEGRSFWSPALLS